MAACHRTGNLGMASASAMQLAQGNGGKNDRNPRPQSRIRQADDAQGAHARHAVGETRGRVREAGAVSRRWDITAKFAGTSAWERHPNGDEIVQIIDGATTLYLLTDEGKQSMELKAGMLAVVPQNAWHQFVAPDGVCVMTATPLPTEHLRVDVEDPRTAG
jgi:quercetin dioxygenase-like cupin family protein